MLIPLFKELLFPNNRRSTTMLPMFLSLDSFYEAPDPETLVVVAFIDLSGEVLVSAFNELVTTFFESLRTVYVFLDFYFILLSSSAFSPLLIAKRDIRP